MKSPNDHDIRERFQALKREVDACAPAWEDCWKSAPKARRPLVSASVMRIGWIAVAALVVCAAVMIWPGSDRGTLVRTLPPLFERNTSDQFGAFLAILEPRQQAAWPSDSFIPQHISLINP